MPVVHHAPEILGHMDQQDRVARIFDEVADTYDAVGVEFFQPIASGLVAALDPQPGERAVDMGCGRGAVLVRLIEAVGPSGQVTGLDLSPRMVEATATDLARAGLNVEVRVGDVMSPNLPPGDYDVVASSLVLFFLPDPPAALRGWRELLVDGGRIGVSTFGSVDERWAETVDTTLQAFVPKEIAAARPARRQGPFGSDQAMERLLTEAGYRKVRTLGGVVAPRFDDGEQWYRWSMSAGQREFWNSVPQEQVEEVKAAAFAAVAKCRREDGRIGFDQQVRYTLGVR